MSLVVTVVEFWRDCVVVVFLFFFFFSSRRRHTRLQGDWSSDVCSSDLVDSRFSKSLISTRKGSGSPCAVVAIGIVDLLVPGSTERHQGPERLGNQRTRSDSRDLDSKRFTSTGNPPTGVRSSPHAKGHRRRGGSRPVFARHTDAEQVLRLLGAG